MHLSNFVNIFDNFVDHQLLVSFVQIFDFFGRAMIFVSSLILVLMCLVNFNWLDCLFDLKNYNLIDYLIARTFKQCFYKKSFINCLVQTLENVNDIIIQNLFCVCFVNYWLTSRELHVFMNNHIFFYQILLNEKFEMCSWHMHWNISLKSKRQH